MPSRALYPIRSASSGVMVVKTAPVSSTKCPRVVPRGPVRNVSTMIRSPSITKEISRLVIEDEGGTGRAHGDAAGVVVADQVVVVPPPERRRDRRGPCLAM